MKNVARHGNPGVMVLTIAAFGYAFLYVPIVSVVVYSFNDSRLVTLWGGFSLRWYRSLLHDSDILSAALLSLEIAAISATVAMILGTLAGLALDRCWCSFRPSASSSFRRCWVDPTR